IRFRERHVVYVAPGLAIAAALVCKGLVSGGAATARTRALVAFSVALCVFSGFRTARSDFYGKEDYRGAIRAAMAMGADRVFVEGYPVAYEYYGLKPADPDDEETWAGATPGVVDVSLLPRRRFEEELARTQGRVALVAMRRREWDGPRLYAMAKDRGTRFNSFAVVCMEAAEMMQALRGGG
ncbi:MAG: hypothetical protein IJ678_03475, partial [Kiritimatiellae bacterium]|nr:hypothetical protein [Kiritimatiellia bacterium]